MGKRVTYSFPLGKLWRIKVDGSLKGIVEAKQPYTREDRKAMHS